MAKILNLWEMDYSRMPADQNERMAMIGKQIEMTKKMLAEGRISDWGLFAGGGAGYGIGPADATEVLKNVMVFVPYVKFQAHPVLSIDEVAQVFKSMKT
jgi:muconolactone delta-isomerase